MKAVARYLRKKEKKLKSSTFLMSALLTTATVLTLTPALPTSVHAARMADATLNAPPVPGAAALKAKYGSKNISITYVGGSVGNDHTRDLLLAARFYQDTGIDVNIVEGAGSSTDHYSQLVRDFQGHSSAFDVMVIDVVWPGAFAPYLVDLKPYLSSAEIGQQAAGIVANDTVGGHLVAMPWFGDYGILYYRTDLLKKYGFSAPPTTWDQLTTMANTIATGERKSNPSFSGFVFQGDSYEGLTCDALEWLASSGTPNFVVNGKADLNNPSAVKMLNLVKGWVGTISPRGVTSYQEPDSLNVFQSGNAAFMRNWPYAYAISAAKGSKIAGKFDVTTLPAEPGSKPVGTVGGWQLAVSKYSKNIPASVAFVQYLTSPAVEKFDALFGGYVPTIASVASDPAVRVAEPFLKPQIANVLRVARPAGLLGINYQQASTDIYQGMNKILQGADPASVLPGIDSKLNALLAKH
jgi:trehalose/maltose transport system substrate-binding protein